MRISEQELLELQEKHIKELEFLVKLSADTVQSLLDSLSNRMQRGENLVSYNNGSMYLLEATHHINEMALKPSYGLLSKLNSFDNEVRKANEKE
tara:strand:- start:6578 stop:6859 length:282 start_codon:yes stop_codon:yes gene_type:complete